MNRVYSFSLSLATLLASAAAVRGEGAKPTRTDLYGDPLPPGAVARLGTIRLRHANADVAFTKDGKQLISCGLDGEVRVWDVATGALLRRKRLAAKSHAEPPFGFDALSPHGAMVARNGKPISLYDTTTGEVRGRFPIEDFSRCVVRPTFSPDGTILAIRRCDDRDRMRIQLWDLADGKKRQTLTSCQPSSYLWNIAFSPDGKRLAAIGEKANHTDHLVYLWDTISGEEISQRETPAKAGGSSLAFAPDGKVLAIVSRSKNEVRLLETAALKEKRVLKVPADVETDSISLLTFSPDGRLLIGAYHAVGSRERGILIWDLAGTKQVRRLPETLRFDARLKFTPDGKTLACHDNWGSEIRLLDTASGRQRHLCPGHDSAVEALAVSPDGAVVASSDHNRTLRLWDAATGKPLGTVKGSDSWVKSCLFSPDGKQVISAGVKNTFQVWDVATGKEQRRIDMDWPTPRGVVELHTVGISADGKRLAVAASGGKEARTTWIFVWDLATGEQRLRRSCTVDERVWDYRFFQQIKKNKSRGAAFAPDGGSVTVWLGERIGIEEVSTGGLLAVLPKDVGDPLIFSPDGRLVASAVLQLTKAPPDGNILESPSRIDVKGLSLIEAASGEEVIRLETGEFDRVAFAPDGCSIVVTDKKSLRVWNTATGARLHQMAWSETVLDGHDEAKVCSLVVLPGGRAATGMSEGDILIWDLSPSTWPVHKSRDDLGRKELKALWSDLAGDAHQAHRAIPTLAAAPAQAVPYLNDHLQPVTLDIKHIEKLLADLDGASFAARETATRELTRMRYRVEPMLRRALKTKPSLEMRRRLQAILAGPSRPSTEAMRTLRAIAVLERIGTPEARRILEKLAGGAATPETREAKATLQRLNRRFPLAKERSAP